MVYSRVAAVTGANKGIGLAIVRNLALQYPHSSLNSGPLLILLTARDPAKGKAAREALLNDAQLTQAKALRKNGGLTDIDFQTLDISSEHSRRDFAELLQKEHPKGIDVLINNAGRAMDGLDKSIAQQTIDTNYYSSLDMTTLMVPLMKPGGRIVNIASMTGKLRRVGAYSEALAERFTNATSVKEISVLMDEFVESVSRGTLQQDGWPSTAYGVSKSGVIGFTGILGRQALDQATAQGTADDAILINSCCPGYVNTDMSKGRGSLSPDQGAATPVHLALGDIGLSAGEFWERKKISSW